MSEVGEKALVSAGLLAVTVPVFFAAGMVTGAHAPVAWLVTGWDAAIPLAPWAVWIYFSWYLAPWLLLSAPRRSFRRVATAVILAFAICTIGYVVLPAAMERPVVQGVTVSERALRLLYAHDPPWNIFPSFHAALCAVLWRPMFGGGWARRVMPWWMMAICVACVLTKQHNVADILAGLVVGFGAMKAAGLTVSRLEAGRAGGALGGGPTESRA